MAMLPFCGYNMADYFGHWLSMGRRLVRQPRIFHINWFRTGEDGKFLWPGFGENVRVLKWVLERVDGKTAARSTPMGNVPATGSLDLSGLDVSTAQLEALLAVDLQSWLGEVAQSEAFLAKFGDRLPSALMDEHRALRDRLSASIS
jgi:phosphoenolpyruvate carboxykinase (GTP)